MAAQHLPSILWVRARSIVRIFNIQHSTFTFTSFTFKPRFKQQCAHVQHDILSELIRCLDEPAGCIYITSDACAFSYIYRAQV